MRPKISVIVPIYNVEKYIERCVRSLMEQTLDGIEYIFVDDGSPDKSRDILLTIVAEYPHRTPDVRVLTHEKNKGLTVARNTGLAVATGEYIAHCDSDDWVDPHMYEVLYKKAKQEHADLVYCDFWFVYPSKCVEYKTVRLSDNKEQFLRSYIQTTWTVLWNILVRKDLYDLNALHSPENICYCEDFNLAVRLFYVAAKITKVETPLYYYNQLNNSSIVHRLDEKAQLDEQWAYLDIIRFFEKQGVANLYHKELGWRVLKSKQEWVLDKSKYVDFLALYPDCHKYIWSCPYLNKKLKIMMWCLTHHLSWITSAIIYFRNLKDGLVCK